MKQLLIQNYGHNYHYEIIESVIVKYFIILNIDKTIPIDIYLHISHNDSFQKYIQQKYPHVKFKNIKKFDYYIHCTVYDRDFKNLDVNPNKKYISHEITERLHRHPNVVFLPPLAKKNFFYANVLPFSEKKKKTKIPIYIIQGNLNQNRRDWSLLTKILDKTYKYKFFIKLIGRGRGPPALRKYKDKIILKNNLNFIDFHKEFLDGYCILPLSSKHFGRCPFYYTTKLTSTINYALGYKLKCLIDRDLQDIYNLKDVEIFNDMNDITIAFEKTLETFYLGG